VHRRRRRCTLAAAARASGPFFSLPSPTRRSRNTPTPLPYRSNALKVTGIWANTIGVESEMGGNTAIEDSLYAPGKGHGSRKDKQQRAQELIQSSGFQPAVTDYEGLMALAKQAAGGGTANRGACKVCGGLGHLTKQCRNGGAAAGAAAAAAGEGAADARGGMGLLTEADDDDGLADLLGGGSGSDSDGSGSNSDRGRRGSKVGFHGLGWERVGEGTF
jgi:hypothetical protein